MVGIAARWRLQSWRNPTSAGRLSIALFLMTCFLARDGVNSCAFE